MIGTNEQLVAFKQAFIEPARVDRAGAANEQAQQDIIAALKSHWGQMIIGLELAWRLWASHITGKDQHLHVRLIEQPPPQNIIRLFEPVAQEFVQRLVRNVDLARDVVDGLMLEMNAFRRQFEVLHANLEAMQVHLQSKKHIIDGIGSSL